jgi:hypothetical protein
LSTHRIHRGTCPARRRFAESWHAEFPTIRHGNFTA